MNRRWVCLDVGETLIDETRAWSIWADVLGIPQMTFMAAFGAVVERGRQHQDVFSIFGASQWRDHVPEVRRRYAGFQASDLYPDVHACLERLTARGLRLAIIGNQPAERKAELRRLGVEAEVMAMSEELGVAKPDEAFFRRSLHLMGDPPPSAVAYVGDRIDNDVWPAAAMGLRAVWLRRGPWGVIPEQAPPEASLVVDSLAELSERVTEAWA